MDKLWICVTLLRITLKYMIKRVFFSYFLYNFGTKVASFVQFLTNFDTKMYKNCTKNDIFLLYLWINVVLLRICVALLCIKRRFLCVLMLLLDIYLISFLMIWYAYLHKLPPIGVYNMVYTILNIRFCIQYSAYYMVFHTISLCVK